MTDTHRNSTRPALSAPRILVISTNHWPVVPRLVIALREMGCTVAILCPTTHHPVQKLDSIGPIFHYDGRQPIESLERAIEAFDPGLVLPCCDRSVQHLHELHKVSQSSGHKHNIAVLIETSLGAPSGFPITSSRFQLLEIAKSEGILVPATTAIQSEEDLRLLNTKSQPPWMIKADGTWGGKGVRIATSVSEANRFLFEFSKRPGTAKLLKQLILNSDRDWVLFDWKDSRRSVIAQSVIAGRAANCAVFCWEGKVLAGTAVEVVQSRGETGPATVVEIVPGLEMIAAAKKIARRLEMSGFFGLDFMIENGTGSVYLIEMNPRCTPPTPLPLGEGHDLLIAMWAQLTDQRPRNTRQPIAQKIIKYFPEGDVNNIKRQNASDLVYRDVSNGERELIQELLQPRSRRSMIGKAIDAVR
jgi:Carbamoyl-phosphate synthase L chain, ATP binding domain